MYPEQKTIGKLTNPLCVYRISGHQRSYQPDSLWIHDKIKVGAKRLWQAIGGSPAAEATLIWYRVDKRQVKTPSLGHSQCSRLELRLRDLLEQEVAQDRDALGVAQFLGIKEVSLHFRAIDLG